jgi:Tfp pilus assembly protein PilF
MPSQKPNVKNTPPASGSVGWFDKASLWLFGTSIDFGKFRDISKNNYALGLAHLENGNLRDAVLRFKMVTWLEPRHVEAWYQLGCAQLIEGKKQAAVQALRKALAIAPGHEQAKQMLAAALGESSPPPD